MIAVFDRAIGAEIVVTIATDPYWMEALRCRESLRSYLRQKIRNVAIADELLQEVYARFTAVDKSKVRSINSYLFSTAHHLAVDWLRRQARNPVVPLAETEAPEPVDHRAQPERVAIAHQELTRLIEAVNQLPPQRRKAFVLRKVYGFTPKQIAALMSIAESTVLDHLRHALRDLARLPLR